MHLQISFWLNFMGEFTAHESEWLIVLARVSTHYANFPAWLCQGISVLACFTLENGLARHVMVVAHGMTFSSRATKQVYKEESSSIMSVAGVVLLFLMMMNMVLSRH